jgi:hypothetical protein
VVDTELDVVVGPAPVTPVLPGSPRPPPPPSTRPSTTPPTTPLPQAAQSQAAASPIDSDLCIDPVDGRKLSQDLMRSGARVMKSAGIPSTFMVIPKATHGEMGPTPEQTMGEALDWLWAHQKPEP